MPSPTYDLHVVFDLVSNTLAKAGGECLLVGGFAVYKMVSDQIKAMK